MNLPVRIGMDTSKSVFQLHGVDENEVVVIRRQLRRAEMVRYFERLPPALVAIESCGSSRHWARLLQSFGHEVRLIPPQYVKPYVERGKNDSADAEALCEAVTRPSMRFVPVKSKERQAACMLMTVRERLVSVKSQTFKSGRDFAAWIGLTPRDHSTGGRQSVDAAEIRERYPDLLADDAQVWVGAGWTEVLNDAFDAVKDRDVVVRVAREHCAGLHLIIGPVGEWTEADFDLAAEMTERTWARSLQVCETCGCQSAQGAWSRYRTRCAEHTEVW